MTIFAPSNPSRPNRATGGFSAAKIAAEERHADQLQRMADPTEQHVRFIRIRGFSIYRSSVVGGPDDRWRYCGRDITADEVADEADRIRARMTGPAAAPAPTPTIEPESQKARKPEILIAQPEVQAPVASSDIQPTVAPSDIQPEETSMASTDFEIQYCKARGTTPARVRREMRALKDRLGARGAAEALGVGFSTFTNALSLNAGIGPTLLNALYGESGCELRPELRDDPVVEQKPAEETAAVNNEPSLADAVADAIDSATIETSPEVETALKDAAAPEAAPDESEPAPAELVEAPAPTPPPVVSADIASLFAPAIAAIDAEITAASARLAKLNLARATLTELAA